MVKMEKTESTKKKKGPLYSVLLGMLFGLTAAMMMLIVLHMAGYDREFLSALHEGGTVVKNSDTIKSAVVEEAKEEQKSDEQDSEAKEASNIESDSKAQDAVLHTSTDKRAVVTDVTEVVEAVMRSVVALSGTYMMEEDFWGYQYEEEGSGSGIIIGQNDSELLIVTNNHVVQDATSLMVQFVDDETAEAKVKGTDSTADLAVVSVELDTLSDETKNQIKVAVLGDSETLKTGESAIAIGNALGYGQSVTTGVISAVNRSYVMDEDGNEQVLIQTDAAINPGNSGGALLNVRGEVIGINSNKIAQTTIEGMGYAIPISYAKPIIEKLASKKTRDKVSADKKAYLGITGVNVTESAQKTQGLPKGVYVTQVLENTPAWTCGISEGDVIVEFDGEIIETMEDLSGVLSGMKAGEVTEVKIMKLTDDGYTEQTLEITLGKKE